mgnify:CR=1 FL=1
MCGFGPTRRAPRSEGSGYISTATARASANRATKGKSPCSGFSMIGARTCVRVAGRVPEPRALDPRYANSRQILCGFRSSRWTCAGSRRSSSIRSRSRSRRGGRFGLSVAEPSDSGQTLTDRNGLSGAVVRGAAGDYRSPCTKMVSSRPDRWARDRQRAGQRAL